MTTAVGLEKENSKAAQPPQIKDTVADPVVTCPHCNKAFKLSEAASVAAVSATIPTTPAAAIPTAAAVSKKKQEVFAMLQERVRDAELEHALAKEAMSQPYATMRVRTGAAAPSKHASVLPPKQQTSSPSLSVPTAAPQVAHQPRPPVAPAPHPSATSATTTTTTTTTPKQETPPVSRHQPMPMFQARRAPLPASVAWKDSVRSATMAIRAPKRSYMAIPEFGGVQAQKKEKVSTVEDMSLKQCQELIMSMKAKVDETQGKKPKSREQREQEQKKKLEELHAPLSSSAASSASKQTPTTTVPQQAVLSLSKSRSVVIVKAATLKEWLRESGSRRGVDLVQFAEVLEKASWTLDRLKHDRLSQDELARLGIEQPHRKALALCAQSLRHATAASTPGSGPAGDLASAPPAPPPPPATEAAPFVRSYNEDKPPEDLKLFASDLSFDLSSLLPNPSPNPLTASAPPTAAAGKASPLATMIEAPAEFEDAAAPSSPTLKLPTQRKPPTPTQAHRTPFRTSGSPLRSDLFVDDELFSKLDQIEQSRQAPSASAEHVIEEGGSGESAPRASSSEELEAGRRSHGSTSPVSPTRIDEHELDRRPKRHDDGGGPPADVPTAAAGQPSTTPTRIDEHELDRRPKRHDDGGGPHATGSPQEDSSTTPTRIDEHELDKKPKRHDDGGGPPMESPDTSPTRIDEHELDRRPKRHDDGGGPPMDTPTQQDKKKEKGKGKAEEKRREAQKHGTPPSLLSGAMIFPEGNVAEEFVAQEEKKKKEGLGSPPSSEAATAANSGSGARIKELARRKFESIAAEESQSAKGSEGHSGSSGSEKESPRPDLDLPPPPISVIEVTPSPPHDPKAKHPHHHRHHARHHRRLSAGTLPTTPLSAPPTIQQVPFTEWSPLSPDGSRGVRVLQPPGSAPPHLRLMASAVDARVSPPPSPPPQRQAQGAFASADKSRSMVIVPPVKISDLKTKEDPGPPLTGPGPEAMKSPGRLARFFSIREKHAARPTVIPPQQLSGSASARPDITPASMSSPRVSARKQQRDEVWSLEDDEEERRHTEEEKETGARVSMFDEADSDENVRFFSAAEQASLPGGMWAAAAATVAGEGTEGHRIIWGGTLAKLVQYLTSEKYADREFVEAFVVSHRGFVSDDVLMELLSVRYVVHHSAEDLDWKTFKRTMLLPIRLRCVNVLKSWMTLCPEDFRGSSALVSRARAFIAKLDSASLTAKTVSRVLDKALLDTTVGREFSLPPPPEPLLYEAVQSQPSTCTFADAHPEEIARQIAMIEWSLWQAIRPQEFMNNAWVKPGKDEKAPHIIAMIKASNFRTNWVCSEILKYSERKARALALNKFVAIAERSLAINNYNAVMEIYAALQSAPIHRLRATWELLTPKAQETYDQLKKLWGAEGNWATLRETLRRVVPPCIPYLGFFLTDVTFINEGNPDFIPGTRLINFSKWRTVAAVMKEVMRFQETPMNFRPIRWIVEALHTPAMDPDQQWDRSIALEESRKKGSSKDKKLTEKLTKEIVKEEKRSRRLRKPGAEDEDSSAPSSSASSTPSTPGTPAVEKSVTPGTPAALGSATPTVISTPATVSSATPAVEKPTEKPIEKQPDQAPTAASSKEKV